MPRRSKSTEEGDGAKQTKWRHQYNFTPRTGEELKFMIDELGCTSETEGVRQAISFMAWVLEQLKEGNKLCVQYPNGRSETLVIFTVRTLKTTSE